MAMISHRNAICIHWRGWPMALCRGSGNGVAQQYCVAAAYYIGQRGGVALKMAGAP